MASGSDSLGARLLESLKFWTVVAVLCAIVGIGTYFFGRDYVGEHLHEMEVEQRTPEIQPQTTSPSLAADDDTSANPPVEPVVLVREREPTSREERRALRELEEAPEAGEAHESEEEGGGEDAADNDEGTEQAASGEQAEESGGSGYVVIAGSFADEANAERRVQDLAERGYQPFITTQERDGVTYRRVTVGVFGSREDAENVQEKLNSQGFEAAVWSEG
jgi:cell division protein FtsN